MNNYIKKNNVKIYGDIMVDSWIIGKYTKKSQEAPIKIFSEKNYKNNLGGAGNLIMNLKNLNVKFKFFCHVGNDKNGKHIENLLKKNNIAYYLKKINQPTTIKTRFVNSNFKHYFRSDFEKITNFSKKENFFTKKILLNDFVIISDYAKGCIGKNTVKNILKKKCKIFVDPKNPPNYFKNVFLIKPNMNKFNEWFGKFTKQKALKAMRKMNWQWLVITDGEKGVHVFKKNGENTFYKTNKVKYPDVTGAGDVFFSALIYSYLKGYDIFAASCLANNAASKLVSKKGIQLVEKKDLKSNIVFTNGVFDTFHKGHKKLINFAKDLGNKLIVGINSDQSVRVLKGKNRPYDKLKNRIANLKKTKLISKIIVFNSKTPIKIINKIKPDLIVKGDDYKFNNVVGKNLSNIIIFPRIKNFSSSKIINKII